MIEQAIYSVLSGNAAVSALVSTRIYPTIAPEGASLPFLAYRRVETEHVQTKSRTQDDLARARIEVRCVASSYSGVRTLADKVRLALHGYAGTSGSYTIRGTISEGEYDSGELPPDGTDVPRHVVVNDYGVWFSETAPS